MIFALGFLLASLCALLLVPVLNNRAMRLSRRRVEGLLPLSAREIAAERDALRAEFAVAQRRLERKVEAAESKRHGDMATLGTRELEVAALGREVETRDTALGLRKAEIEQAVARISGLDTDLSQLRSEHAAGLSALTALEDAHREIIVDLKQARRERDGARHDVQEVMAEEGSEAALARSRAHESSVAEATKSANALSLLRAEHDAVLADRESLRTSLRAAEDALAKAKADPGEATGSEQIARENADLRKRITDVADALVRGERLPSVGTFPATART